MLISIRFSPSRLAIFKSPTEATYEPVTWKLPLRRSSLSAAAPMLPRAQE